MKFNRTWIGLGAGLAIDIFLIRSGILDLFIVSPYPRLYQVDFWNTSPGFYRLVYFLALVIFLIIGAALGYSWQRRYEGAKELADYEEGFSTKHS
jgi:hypothetical protein